MKVSFQHSLRQTGRGFSLIELLVVLGVASVVMSVTMPTLLNSQKAMALTQAGNRMADLARTARQAALSKNAIIALIISKPQSSPPFQQAAILLQYDGLENTWTALGKWISLPDAIQAVDNYPDTTPVTNLAPIGLKWKGNDLTDYTALVFYPDGHMVNGSASREIMLSSTKGNPQVNYYKLAFNSDTSACFITRP